MLETTRPVSNTKNAIVGGHRISILVVVSDGNMNQRVSDLLVGKIDGLLDDLRIGQTDVELKSASYE